MNIDTLFDRMFDDDADFKKLLPIAPAIISDMKEEFRAKFEIVVKEFKFFVLRKAQEKEEEGNAIQRCIESVKGASDGLCLTKLATYDHQKKQLVKVVYNSRNPKEVDDALVELREQTQNISSFLMNAEMVIIEQFEEVIKEFERNYTEFCNSINENGQSSFSRLRDLEAEHVEKFGETVLAMYERFNKGDIEDVDDDIRDIMGDKDILMNAINSSHDFRLLKIDQQEDLLITGILRITQALQRSLNLL